MATTVIVYPIACFSFVSAIFVITMSGYFFARMVLKIVGLHTGSPQHVKTERKLAAVLAAIVLVIVILSIGAYFAPEPELTQIGAG